MNQQTAQKIQTRFATLSTVMDTVDLPREPTLGALDAGAFMYMWETVKVTGCDTLRVTTFKAVATRHYLYMTRRESDGLVTLDWAPHAIF